MIQNNARRAALDALERCRRSGAWSGASVDGAIKKYGLDRRDAALAARLCLGVLQNAACLDFYISAFSSRKLADIEPKTLDILRLGAYQLSFMDKIPAAAAVDESVKLCNICGMKRASGYVNAVLRHMAEKRNALPEPPGKGSAEYLSVKYSYPEWLVERLIGICGYGSAEDFFKVCNTPAPLTVQVNSLKISAGDYEQMLSNAGIEFTADSAIEGCLYINGGNVANLPGYAEGLFYVQDKAARLAAAIADPKPGMKLLDCCAAPGGKSFAAAMLMQNRGEILSRDIHEKKLGLIRSGAERLGISIISTAAEDARESSAELENAFDVVICDVPCSGMGVIRKKPEIRQKSPAELSGLPEIQREIIANAAGFVKPGGTLLYSTCTIFPEENEDVVRAFLEENAEFYAEDFSLCGIESREGMYTFFPHLDGSDGFFAARLKRKS